MLAPLHRNDQWSELISEKCSELTVCFNLEIPVFRLVCQWGLWPGVHRLNWCFVNYELLPSRLIFSLNFRGSTSMNLLYGELKSGLRKIKLVLAQRNIIFHIDSTKLLPNSSNWSMQLFTFNCVGLLHHYSIAYLWIIVFRTALEWMNTGPSLVFLIQSSENYSFCHVNDRKTKTHFQFFLSLLRSAGWALC